MTAEMLLKDAATAWVSQELEQQRVPFYSAGGSSEEKISKRRIVTATGALIVEIDSVKEIKRLLSSVFWLLWLVICLCLVFRLLMD